MNNNTCADCKHFNQTLKDMGECIVAEPIHTIIVRMFNKGCKHWDEKE